MSNPLMRCGHTAQAVDKDGKPVCAICIGINLGAEVLADKMPDLTGRIATCPSCKTSRPSDIALPFFEFGKNGSPTDSYYCGCRGWD